MTGVIQRVQAEQTSTTNGLLSRETKTIAFGDPIHLLPTFVRDRSGDLARDPFELTLCRGLGHARRARVACIDLTLEAAVYRIKRQSARAQLGSGSERPRQIFAASRFEISLCRGTASTAPVAGLHHKEWAPPSRFR